MTPKKLMKVAVLVAVTGLVLGLVAMRLSRSSDPQAPLAGDVLLPLGSDSPQTQTIVQPSKTVVVPADPQPQPSQDPQPTTPPDTDNDHDGVSNDTDNCPNAANPDQADFDADGHGDICDADDDNDNLSDAAESGYGTNAYKKDTDGDGWWDGNEVNYGTDPLDPSSHPTFKFKKI